MNKDIENLINPPWLASIQNLQKQLGFATLISQESEAIRSFKKLSESAKLNSLTFSQSEAIKSLQQAIESSKLASLAFHESEAMKSIRELTESNRFKALVLQESEIIKSLKTKLILPQLSSIAFQQSQIAEQLQSLAKTSQMASIAFSQSEAFKKISQFNNLTSFKALTNLYNSPFSDLASINLYSTTDEDLIADESLLEIDAQILDEVSSNKDFNELSEKTKNILIYLYHNYFLPILLSCISAYIMTNAVEAKKELQIVQTPAEAKAFVRSPHSSFDRSALKGFRVTTADSLNLRESPSSRSQIITTLPIGTLVEVIDKSRRSWILVEVEIDGKLEQGWISRRYTIYFR